MIDLGEILKARHRIKKYIHKTPLMLSETLSNEVSAEVYLKLESLQKTGAFKIRGIYNKILYMLEEHSCRAFVTASSGNHGLGLAYACNQLNLKATIVVPTYTPKIKVQAIRRLGAELILFGSNWNESYAKAEEIANVEGSHLIHPFDDDWVICGQGTIGLEVLEDLNQPDYFVASIGGGSMIGSNALVFKELSKVTQVIGLQTFGADAMFQSIKSGKQVKLDSIQSKVESFATKEVSKKTFDLAHKYVDEIFRLTDQECDKATFFMLERSHILIELSAAICVAALFKQAFPFKGGQSIVLTLCGGNYDLQNLASLIQNNQTI